MRQKHVMHTCLYAIRKSRLRTCRKLEYCTTIAYVTINFKINNNVELKQL